MAWLKKLAIGLGVLILLAAVVGFFLPDSAHVERSIVINNRPAMVFKLLNSFELFNRWSPWAEKDPKATYVVSGPASGVGAKQAWHSDDPNVGSGSQEIIESLPDSKIVQKLVFDDMTSGDNFATYTLTPEGDGERTRVVWSYDGRFNGNLLYRYFGLMLDKMLGADYEAGLVKLKDLAEKIAG